MSAPIQTIGGRRFSFGKLSVTNAVRVHLALLKVLGEPLMRLLVLGKDKAEAPRHLGREHPDADADHPPLPGVTPAPAGEEADDAPADDVSIMGIDLTGEDILTLAGVIGLMADRMKESEFIALLALVLSSVRCEGHPVNNIDVTFGDGGSGDMYRVFWEALKVNFTGFFPASLSDFLAKARKARKR